MRKNCLMAKEVSDFDRNAKRKVGRLKMRHTAATAGTCALINEHRRTLLLVLISSFALNACGGGAGGESSSAGGTGPTGPTATGTAVLSWEAPAANTDGSPLNLGGFTIYQGTASCCLHPVSSVPPTATTYTINGLAPGNYYFAITAYDSSGVESFYSPTVQKSVN